VPPDGKSHLSAVGDPGDLDFPFLNY